MKMNILVTGGAGFIGSHIVDRYIELGHKVTVIDNLSTGNLENLNPKAEFYQIDILDPEIEKIFKQNKFDIVNHHAAQIDVRISVTNPIYDAKVNILGGLNLYECCRKFNVKKIIFASSGGTIYGEQKYFPADEKHPLEPCSPYGISKLANEKYLIYYKDIHGIDFVALRYSNVYGPRQNPNGEAGVVAIFSKKFLMGEQPIINGDGKNTRDYVYVSDVVEANVLALAPNVSGPFNIGTATEYDVNFIFSHLKRIAKSPLEAYYGPAKPGEQQRSCLDYSNYKKVTNWRPKVSIEEGLELTVRYFRGKN
ncbi:MAG: NAD-dependent epimerase/dehydratase family protein [Candidatus Kapaibacteriales bacterium]